MLTKTYTVFQPATKEQRGNPDHRLVALRNFRYMRSMWTEGGHERQKELEDAAKQNWRESSRSSSFVAHRL